MKIKEIIFDIGDTIVFTNKIITKSLEVALTKLEKIGLIKDKKNWIEQYDFTSKKLNHLHINHLFSDRLIISNVVENVTGKDNLIIVGAFLTYFREHVRQELDAYIVDTTIFEFLKNNGYILHIISDGTTIEALEILTRLNIIQYFSRIVVSEDYGVEKPSPQIFTEFINESETKPNSFVMIGNHEIRDIKGANAIGFKTILVSEKRTVETEANFVIGNISELSKIL